MILDKPHLFHTEISFDLLDPGMVVYHPNYLVLCDRARSAALADVGYSIKNLWDDGFALALRESKSEYYKPAMFSQAVTIVTVTKGCSRSTLNVQQQMVPSEIFANQQVGNVAEVVATLDSKQVIYEVSMLLVCVKLNPIRPSRLPDRLIHALELPIN